MTVAIDGSEAGEERVERRKIEGFTDGSDRMMNEVNGDGVVDRPMTVIIRVVKSSLLAKNLDHGGGQCWYISWRWRINVHQGGCIYG